MSYTKSLQSFRKRLLQDPTETASEIEAPKSLISRPTVFQPANTVQTQKNDPNAFIESTLRQIRNARMQFEERTAKSLAKAKEEDEVTEQPPMLYRTKAPAEVPTTRGKLSEEKPMPVQGTGRSPADDELYADTSPYKRDGLDLLALSRAIKKIESGGGNYSARGPVVESVISVKLLTLIFHLSLKPRRSVLFASVKLSHSIRLSFIELLCLGFKIRIKLLNLIFI